MNDDRISELYKGEIWSEHLQERAQRRIHWMCSAATGDSVLDVGCSQGIASILLGREGLTVTGIDVQESRIAYAKADLAEESPATQARVEFLVANGGDLPFDDAFFDSVLLGEVLEHLAMPGRLLEEVRRVLKPGGAVAITTPFGISPHRDHKQTFYPHRLLEIISVTFEVRSVDVADRYFRIVAGKPKDSPAGVLATSSQTLETLDGVWHELDAELLSTRHDAAALTKRVMTLEREVDAIRQQKTLAETDLKAASRRFKGVDAEKAKLAKSVTQLKSQIRTLQARAAAAETEVAAAERKVAAAELEVAAVERKSELEVAATERRSAAAAAKTASVQQRASGARDKASARNQALLRRVDRLERDRSQLRNRLALARWKLSSLTARKWWRLGTATGAVRTNPFRVFVLPFDLVSITFSKSNLPPKPAMEKIPPVRKVAKKTGAESGVRATPPSASTTTDLGLRPLVVTAPTHMSLASPVATTASDVRVACVLDEMSYHSFAPECHLVTFTPNDWLEVMEREQPNLLLVESAWRGNSGSWEYKVGTYSYPESIGLPDLTAVVEWCRRRDIPTVFWNKEDPVHFEKFKEAAALFDVVFTTDSNMVERYEQLPGSVARTVDVLPFAAQPLIHNPIDSMQERDVRPVFAGAFYRNRHPERRAQLEMLLDAALPYDLVIYDRMGGAVSDSFGFPTRFRPHIAGTLPYDEMVEVYRRHRVFLNANSVIDSPTMFSRRVFELLACGTPVVSTPSVGVSEMFGGIVAIADDEYGAREAIEELVSGGDRWRRDSLRGIERVFERHTYADRLKTILDAVGIEVAPARPSVTAVVAPTSGIRPASVAAMQAVGQVVALDAAGSAVSGVTRADDTLIRAAEVSDVTDHAVVARVAARAASEPWVAFVRSEVDLAALHGLAIATRMAPADIFTVAGSPSEEHRFISRAIADGPAIVSTEFLSRVGLFPIGATGLTGARMYAVPIVDD